MKRKKVVCFLLAAVMILGVTGCKKEAPKKETTTKKVEKAEEKKEEKPAEEVPANQNLLTGLGNLSDGAIGKRPVAVMVNNVPEAMPQYGVEQADLIFEIPVEGDKTRFMALYADYTAMPVVCAVRSCRYYFPAISQGFDAFYCNWGIDDTIAEYLEQLGLDQYDGMTDGNGLFGRDQDRLNAGYALEHTAFFDGTQFANVVNSNGSRTDLAEDKKGTAFNFNGMNEKVKPSGGDCGSVDINFGAQSSQFTYDAANQVYLKSLDNGPQVDGRTNNQLAFTNVFVLETDISVRDDVGHKSVNWEGGDTYTGHYISNGGIQTIHWRKDPGNESSYLQFTDENGNPLSINRGKSYIAFNYPGQAVFQ
ncbi:DUF3048 domain-containing protein [Hespellia stercorisuis]|uniref:DUF3048 domain-containing protein n=1 Tax=Hespellia stercorisuis DSM 15480 TaxID=1121950 RepID=A0A1M6JYX3_9FIRM|nr:DUF3048 domain-containing protein [Hespellia stercorisuis]SHJ51887.1 Protein of unknown function [Hespellia stercorisuis DSM 15480]